MLHFFEKPRQTTGLICFFFGNCYASSEFHPFFFVIFKQIVGRNQKYRSLHHQIHPNLDWKFHLPLYQTSNNLNFNEHSPVDSTNICTCRPLVIIPTCNSAVSAVTSFAAAASSSYSSSSVCSSFSTSSSLLVTSSMHFFQLMDPFLEEKENWLFVWKFSLICRLNQTEWNPRLKLLGLQ